MNTRCHKLCKANTVFVSNPIYEIMKTMCPPRYHRNGCVVSHALGQMMYGCQVLKCMSCPKAIVLMHDST